MTFLRQPATLSRPPMPPAAGEVRVAGCVEFTPQQIEEFRLQQEIDAIASGKLARSPMGSALGAALENMASRGQMTPHR